MKEYIIPKEPVIEVHPGMPYDPKANNKEYGEQQVRRRTGAVCIAWAKGCPRSIIDTAGLFRYFQSNGWKLTNSFEQADLLLVATCGFCVKSEEFSIKLLAAANRRRKVNSKLVVIGCLAGINKARVEAFGAQAIPPKELEQLDALIDASVKLRSISPVNLIEPYIYLAESCWQPGERSPNTGWMDVIKHVLKTRACSVFGNLKMDGRAASAVTRFCANVRTRVTERQRYPLFRIRVAYGCDEECSYCAIRFAAGSLRSRPLKDVLEEFDVSLQHRYKRIELIAGEIGAYGLDIGTNMVNLFKSLFARTQEFQLVVTDINIKYIIRYGSEIVRLFVLNSDKISSLRLPVQSGSTRILKLMRRGYTAEDALDWLLRLKHESPRLPLGTDVLVGFPGETEEDFNATLELLRQVQFDRIQVFGYSDRSGTLAATMEPKVSQEGIENRVCLIKEAFPAARTY